jgi:hypothetical protein
MARRPPAHHRFDPRAIMARFYRAQAMDVSDRWIEAGKDPAHPLLREERALLVRSYAALSAAVYR